MIDNSIKESKDSESLYRAVWRWHFYSGLFVAPFMLILAVTGLAMMYIGYFDGRDGEKITIPVPEHIETMSLQKQSDIVLSKHQGSSIIEWIRAPQEDRVNVFRIKSSEGTQEMVAINPYTGDIVENWQRRQGWYDLADNIHSDLLIGTTGDRILEIVAGFGIVLLISGIYLWYPRQRKANTNQSIFKKIHSQVGIYLSVFLFLFLLSGMSWTGVWGAKLVQAWSTFPAEKWSKIPLSDKTHASLNHTVSEGMPWALEQTKLPASGSNEGLEGTLNKEKVDIDSIQRLASRLGYEGRYRVSFPKGEQGVWTINQDTMNSDAPNPFSDKTTHVDRYTGKVLAKVTFDDYSLAGKTMAVSIPLHMGLVTIWNLIINTIICLGFMVLAITGVIMWWKRRPKNSGFKLVAPKAPTSLPHYKNAMVLMLLVSLAFPLVGITLICVLLLDIFVVSKISFLKKIFN
jgi:uncharacterized iron-regulated membrane protein